jgi:single-strand DNA-binding protein
MMTQLVTLGRDAELKYTPQGTAVLEFSAAYTYGKKETQWIALAIWGKQGESLAPYLLKGKQIFVCADDVHVEEYQGKDGSTKNKLVGKVVSVKFTKRDKEEGDDGVVPAAARKPVAKAVPVAEIDDSDVPF